MLAKYVTIGYNLTMHKTIYKGQIMLNYDELFIYDDGLLISKKTGTIYCNLDRDGYIRIRVAGKEYRAHRIIWEMHNGPISEGMLIDHIDRDVFNNRIENLRLATRQQNNANKGKISGSLPKGVVKVQNKYRARIYHNGKNTSLGMYNTPEEAGQAYHIAALELNGEFALKQ